jgi:hypothetical protein
MGIQLSLNSVVQAIYLSSVARNEHGGTNDNIAPTSGTSTKTSFMSTTVDEQSDEDGGHLLLIMIMWLFLF